MKSIFLVIPLCFLITTLGTAQEIKIKSKNGTQESISLRGNVGPKPDVYIDGKKYDHEIFELLDADKIESIEIIKGTEALSKYKTPNGVILITSKSNSPGHSSFKIDMDSIKIKGSAKNGKDPMIIIDGKKHDKDTLSDLSPDDIESISVLKGEAAIITYNAPNGVIVVITKKGK